MRELGGKQRWLVALLTLVLLGLGAATPAQGASSDPLFVFLASQNANPGGDFEGPCGLAVDSFGEFYVSDYYHDAVDVYTSSRGYVAQISGLDPLDGPCGLAVDSEGRLYVNGFHRDLTRFTPTSFPPAAYGAAFPIVSNQPTGVAVDGGSNYAYVDARTNVALYEPSGAQVEVGGAPYLVGSGSLKEGYGLAISEFPSTAGYLYVPDAGDDTVKVYDPAADADDPIAVIDGSAIAGGGFVSLRDSAVAVDRANGNVYVADNLQPDNAEHPEATIHVFSYTGAYLGHLKYNIVDAMPPGLAVDNSAAGTQGRVYVTSGNSEKASVYAYPAGAATTAPALCAPGGSCPQAGQAAEAESTAPASAPAAAVAGAAGDSAAPAQSFVPAPAKRPRHGARHGRRHRDRSPKRGQR